MKVKVNIFAGLKISVSTNKRGNSIDISLKDKSTIEELFNYLKIKDNKSFHNLL